MPWASEPSIRVSIPCEHCNNPITFGLVKCTQCQSPISRDARDALHSRLEASSEDYRDLQEQISSAKSVLFIAALVYLANGILAFILSMRAQFRTDEGDAFAFYLLAADISCAIIFASLWRWARYRPATATLVSIAVWISLQVILALVVPPTIFSGLWLKAIVVVLLTRGLIAAVRANNYIRKLTQRDLNRPA